MSETEELRQIVQAQSQLLMTLVGFLREDADMPKPIDLDQDEIDQMFEEVCSGLTPAQVRTYFPLAPEWLRMN